MQELLRKCPGLVGRIARYIDSQLKSSQPGISLSTALAFVATIKSKRVENELGITGNLYTACIAPSGKGKTTAQRIVHKICEKADATNILMGRPASDSGLLSQLKKEPRSLLIWDEFGLALSEMSASKSSYRVSILSTIMDLYSSGDLIYIGKQYAKEDRIDIHRPHLSISAASTPSRFYESLSSDYINDGFIGRWLIFNDDEKEPFRTRNQTSIPTEIIDEVNFINLDLCAKSNDKIAMFENIQHVGDVESVFNRFEMEAENETQRIFWSRGFENTVKVAMCVSSDYVITKGDMIFAYNLVEKLISQTIKKCDSEVRDTIHEKQALKRIRRFMSLFPLNQPISKMALTRKCRHIFGEEEREKLIYELKTQGIIEIQLSKIADSHKQTTFYVKREGFDLFE